jgi:hypothetical protein
MKAVHILTVTLTAAIGFVAGYLIAKPRPASNPSTLEISRAQKAEDKILPPIWARMFRDDPWLNGLRERGYRYCYRSGSVDPACARKQDEAVQAAFFAIDISKAQQKMTDQSRLSLREREVARDPQLRANVIRYCSSLYAAHGNKDARILATCLGNLSEFSPLVPIPVP